MSRICIPTSALVKLLLRLDLCTPLSSGMCSLDLAVCYTYLALAGILLAVGLLQT